MPTIVVHNKTQEQYIVIGTGLGAYQMFKRSRLTGLVVGPGERHEIADIAVSNATGEIVWLSADEVTVLTVDGESPASILGHACS